jgi:HK97 family phage major capsid protein/HK97 family phage prohead protease
MTRLASLSGGRVQMPETETAPLETGRFTIRLAPGAGTQEVFDAALSSTHAVERDWGMEVLSHAPGAVDMERAARGLPLLLDHDPRRQVGRVEAVRLEGDRLRGRLRFGASADARAALEDVRTGIRQELSIGYEILDRQPAGDRRVLVTRWKPMEVSLVSIPADPRVGIGRSLELPLMDTNTAATSPPSDARENRRREEIMALGDLAQERDMAVDAVLSGESLESFRTRVREARQARASKPLGVPHAGPFGDGLGAPNINRGFKVRGFGRGAEVTIPEGFRGQVVRLADGSHAPILTREDKLSAFVPNNDDAHYARELGFAGFVRALTTGAKSSIETRVLATSPAGSGGAMVPTPLAADLIDRLRSEAVLIGLGAQTVPMDAATLRFARTTTDPVGAWRAENANIPDSDPVFDNVTLTKRSWGVLTRFSRELLQDSNPNIELALMNMFARVSALAIDTAGLVGGGVNGPAGIAAAAGIQVQSMGVNGAALTNWVQPLNAVQLLETANSPTITGMVMAPRTARNIYGWTDTTNQPLRPPPRLEGIPMRVTSAMPINETQGTAVNASSILLGDFREVMIGMGPEIELTLHPDRYAELGQIAMIGFVRADIQLQRPAAIARVQGIIP